MKYMRTIKDNRERYEVPTFEIREVLLDQNILSGSANLGLQDMNGEYW